MLLGVRVQCRSLFPSALTAPGEEVIVQEGTLCGARGVVRERRGGRQLVIWVAEIGRGAAFTIGVAMVKAAGTAHL